MKNKKLIISVSIIVVVTVILLIFERQTPFETRGAGERLLPALTERAITAIVVNGGHGGASVRLEKTNGEWMIVEEIAETDSAGETSLQTVRHEADESLVNVAISHLLALRKSELISNNPANQAIFGVDSASGGASIEIFTADPNVFAYKILLGRSGSSWNTFHVRLANSNELYLIPGDITQSLQPSVDFWKRPPPAVDPFIEGLPFEGDALQYIDESMDAPPVN